MPDRTDFSPFSADESAAPISDASASAGAAVSLPTGGAFRRGFSLRQSAIGTLGAGAIILYLVAVLRLPAEQLSGLFLAVAVVGAISTPVIYSTDFRAIRALVRCLDAMREGEPDPAILRDGFRCAVDLPRRMFGLQIVHFQLTPLVVVLVTLWIVPDFGLANAGIVMIAAISGGVLTTLFECFLMKRWIEPIRNELAHRLPDPDERHALVTPFPLAHKLFVAMLAVSVVPVLFAFLLAQSQGTRSVERLAFHQQRTLLDRAVEAFEHGGAPAVREMRRGAAEWGVPCTLDLVELASGRSLLDDSDAATRTAIAAIASTPDSQGVLPGDGEASSWRTLPGGELVVLSKLKGESLPTLASFSLSMMLAFLAAVSVSLFLAWVVGRDVGHEVDGLAAQAARVASGDLRRGGCFESEDELGALSRVYDRMCGSLRVTVEHLSEASSRVETNAEELASVAAGFSEVALEQARGVQSASDSMDAIHERAAEVDASATELSRLAESSSTSTVEIGTAGEQLRDTSAVLSEKIEEVATSVEQMTESVDRVGISTEALSDAAADTSTSIAEMATTMQQVDETAEQTATLSVQVVSASSRGREKVQQTIQGMDSIRDATAAAQQVVHGLGDRTEKMAAILDVIDEVADETTLLALNAAIIAAQAGSHGHAFSVVAAEIKTLAKRVLRSTREIGDVIEAVQSESANAVDAIERGAESVAVGVELSRGAGEALKEIHDTANEAGVQIQQIARAVQEQSKASSHALGLMDHVNDGIHQIRSASTEQQRGNEVVHRSTTAMREYAQQLKATTEEQALGARRLSDSAVGVHDSAAAIEKALGSQRESCAEAAERLEAIAERTRETDPAVERMATAIRNLRDQAARLRTDVDHFRC